MTKPRKVLVPLLICLVLAGLFVPAVAPPLQAAPTLPAGFIDTPVITGLTNPMVVEFADDGRVFVAEKSGLIKVYDTLTDGSPTTFADLRTQVHNFWDRGLLGMALHPDFPANPNVYVLYTRDAVVGGSAPRWGTPGVTGDGCPTPPGATDDGCVVSGRLSRLTASGNTATGETVLIDDWCQQYPSHSVGSLVFGADGALYASAGDGASFNFTDYGQDGNPVNPCGDPLGATPPASAEGGALRSQDIRTTGDPLGLDGTIIRIDPATGQGLANNPNGGSPDANTRRVVANGMRNPFRMTVRPGTSEIWFGDVGWGGFEEIDRVVAPADTTVDNFGWPCYEGSNRQGGYDGANVNLCESLYTAGAGAVVTPHHAYRHGQATYTGDPCVPGSSGSSTAGVAFYGDGEYPDSYNGALFYADYSRDCIWVMRAGAGGLPDPATRTVFYQDAANPVNLVAGPGGDLYYPDFQGGSIRRIAYSPNNAPPVARVTSTPASGSAPLTVTLDGSGSTDPDAGDVLAYEWDLDDDGAYDDATGPTTTFTYTAPGSYRGRLRVRDLLGLTATASVTVNVDNSAPSAAILSPEPTIRWKVGDTITFSGTATDPQQGNLPSSALSWEIILKHCETGGGCHEHPVTTVTGASGSFSAPDHEYPSTLLLRLTATDAGGLTDTETIELRPATVNLTFATSPPGLRLAVNGDLAASPATATVIVGSRNSVSAITPQTFGGRTHTFAGWSDGGAQSHDITAPATATTYTATFNQGGGTFTDYARINFQPSGAPVPAGYTADTGAVYGDRGSGRAFGWNASNSAQTRDRNSTRSADQRYDTLTHLQKPGSSNPNAAWEIAVPEGIYRVTLVAGDASYYDSNYQLAVEGTLAVSGTPTTSNRWITGTVDVTVTDGRLTITNAPGASNNKLTFVDIRRLSG
jgi:glucose/arabinose dehydrogenase